MIFSPFPRPFLAVWATTWSLSLASTPVAHAQPAERFSPAANLAQFPSLEEALTVRWPVPGQSPQLLHWPAGTRIVDVLTLEDVADSLALDELTLSAIEQTLAQPLKTVSLAAINLVAQQTVETLSAAIPALNHYQIGDVPVLAALLDASQVSYSPHNTVSQLLDHPALRRLPLNKIDLRSFPVETIPGLMQTPLHRFAGWRQTSISQIPGLAQFPLTALPGGLGGLSQWARVDWVLGSSESQIHRSISGGDQVGFAVPCEQNCAHLELGAPFEGYAWMSGNQQVRGGFGVLGQVNAGREPTGRTFGPGKLVVTSIDEASGTAQLAMYFRKCIRTPIDLGCTPYALAPVPWMQIREGQWLPIP